MFANPDGTRFEPSVSPAIWLIAQRAGAGDSGDSNLT
jgi:hypothetical protein